MRILLLSLADLTASTADSITTIKMGRALAAFGHDVIVAAPRQDKRCTAVDPGNARVRFHWNAQRLGLPNTINSIVQLLRLGVLQRPGKVDLVYVRFATFTFAIGAWCRLTDGPPVFSEHHGWSAAERRMHDRYTWLAPFERLCQMLDARFARKVRTVVPGIRDLLLESGVPADRVVVVGNACDTDQIVPCNRATALHTYDLDENEIYLGFLGSLTHWQGLEVVVDGFALACEQQPRLRLLIVGDGPLRAALEARVAACGIEAHVRFLGRTDHSAVSTLLSCFDIAVLPTATSAYADIGRSPLKLREYAAAGRTILAAQVPGVEDVRDEPWLHFYPPGDSSAFARAVLSLVSAPYALGVASARARRYAEENFSWPVITGRVIDELGLVALGQREAGRGAGLG